MDAEVSKDTKNMKQTLDSMWQEVSKERAVDFLKRAVGPKTTVTELASILSYEKVAAAKEQLDNIAIGDILAAPSIKVQERPQRSGAIQRRARSLKNDIDREEKEILAVVKENPGINRGLLAKRVKNRLGNNKTLAHLSYLLHRLTNDGRLKKIGSRRDATYETAA